MAYPDPVMTSTRPRLVVLKGSVPLDPVQIASLRAVFDVVEVHSAQAAKKMLDGSVGGMLLCAPNEQFTLAGEPLPTAATTILERIGEGVGVVDQAGTVLWTDARFKVADEHVRSEFVRLCRHALELFNRPAASEAGRATRRQARRFEFDSGEARHELIVSPASLDQVADRVTTGVGVMWEITSSRRLQATVDAIDAAGADLLRIESSLSPNVNMAERLKSLERKIVAAVRDILRFDNFEIRLIDRETGQLELVIAVNIAPLKIGEVMYSGEEGNGISGRVAATGKSYICPDVQNDDLYREGLENARSSLTVPLMLNERVLGTFNIESCRPDAFTDTDRRFAEIYGRYIAAALNILDLLVVERYTTNQQITGNILTELAGPLNDALMQAQMLRESAGADAALISRADELLATLTKLRSSMDTCAAGPRTILGAEQELHRHEIDPLVKGRSILIADDEPAIRDTLDALLTQKGASVTVCSNGAETIRALQQAHREGRVFDLVISDIKMPDRNGYEVYRAAKEIKAETPVILMTGFGYDPHHCIVRASQEGLQSFLFKPFKASQLMEVLAKSLTPR